MAAKNRQFDGEALRVAMRQVPSAVTVVTANGEGEIRGITIGSFTSVSLEPPLISFNVAKDAQMHDLLVSAPRFAVHILSEEQAYLADHFALPDRTSEEQFTSISYHLNSDRIPILTESLAIFYCEPYAVYPAGDHSLVVGEVLDVKYVQSGAPLVYVNRGYRGVGDEVNLLKPVKRASNDSL